jgi:hypothetical protein
MFRTRSLPSAHERPLLSPPLSASIPSFQMPTVLIHPPEEEQDEAMPWCAFDANNETTQPGTAFSTPEMEVLPDAWSEAVLPTAEHAPIFHRAQVDSNVIMPRRGPSDPSFPGKANLHRLSSIPESPKRAKERDDEDIVEVMKVRRGEGMLDVAYAHGTVPARRRSKTLRSRAAQALRSIKNVGKAPRRPTAEHVVPAKENGHPPKTLTPVHVPATATAALDNHKKSLPTQPSTPRLKRRLSQPLSNLFGRGAGSSTVAQKPSDIIGVGTSSSHSGRFQTMPFSHNRSASTSALNLASFGAARPTSPSFSLRSTRHKFSFVNLQSIFSGNSMGTNEPEPEPQPVTASPELDGPALSRTVETPVDDEGWDSGEDYDSPRRHAGLGAMHGHLDEDEGLYPEQEISFEMRLNSLHFDSFSLDADIF